jgi:hypothetical protein
MANLPAQVQRPRGWCVPRVQTGQRSAAKAKLAPRRLPLSSLTRYTVEMTKLIRAAGDPAPKPRGLANLSPERRREIAAQGGAAVHKHHRTFAKDPELARTAGTRGGKARASRAVKRPPEDTEAPPGR